MAELGRLKCDPMGIPITCNQLLASYPPLTSTDFHYPSTPPPTSPSYLETPFLLTWPSLTITTSLKTTQCTCSSRKASTLKALELEAEVLEMLFG